MCNLISSACAKSAQWPASGMHAAGNKKQPLSRACKACHATRWIGPQRHASRNYFAYMYSACACGSRRLCCHARTPLSADQGTLWTDGGTVDGKRLCVFVRVLLGLDPHHLYVLQHLILPIVLADGHAESPAAAAPGDPEAIGQVTV
uniref:Uncharacterized protein n=1 Tax=Lotharella globosa TaxID=91324 RepID=A0A7S3YZH1_9EUKA|mmetsp:Transcript_1030/g.1951  ORF Transcript_1030/g.1951 Transcript_1030/m.1951 type:complete len:147 (+) Transcript_1030:55-495(+)